MVGDEDLRKVKNDSQIEMEGGEAKVDPAQMEGNKAEEEKKSQEGEEKKPDIKPKDDDDMDDMLLEDAPKSEIPEPVDDKSDPGMLAQLKKQEDESKDSPSFLKGMGLRGTNKIKSLVNPDDPAQEADGILK